MLDNHITGPLDCPACGRTCQGQQGLRGHQRGCPGRKQVVPNQSREPEDPVVEPAEPLDRHSNQQVTCGSRLSIEGVEKVLRVHDPVRALLKQLCDTLIIRQVFDAEARANKRPTYENWLNLARDVARLELAIERILQQASVTRDETWTLYQLAMKTRDQWVLWRCEEAHSTWEYRADQNEVGVRESFGNDLDDVLIDFGISQLEANWNIVIEGLRWLTAHTRATL